MWAVGLGIAGILAGFFLGVKLAGTAGHDKVMEVLRSQGFDRRNYLGVLRRELANAMFRTEPDRYVALYRDLHRHVSSFREMTNEALWTRYRALTDKYPLYQDFDMVGTRDHVLYAEGIVWQDFDDLAAVYRDIIHFQALSQILLKTWPSEPVTSDSDLEHAEKSARKFEDTKLQLLLEDAVRMFSAANRGSSIGEAFENHDYAIVMLSHFAELRQGIRLKATNEFGIHGVFYTDDNKGYHSWYRSDPSFQTERSLEVLNGVANDVRAFVPG